MAERYTLGHIAFDAYNDDRGGVNFRGEKTPPWQELTPEIRGAWEASAIATGKALAGKTRPLPLYRCKECGRKWLSVLSLLAIHDGGSRCPQCGAENEGA